MSYRLNTMSRRSHLTGRRRILPDWCAVLCFALVVLLFHNPYLIASGIDGGLKVGHPPSYRVTVAASELQHFSPASEQEIIAENGSSLWELVVPLPLDCRHSRLTSTQIVSPPQQYWGSGLWFRPPPSL